MEIVLNIYNDVVVTTDSDEYYKLVFGDNLGDEEGNGVANK